MASRDPVLEKLRKLCLALPDAEEVVSYGHPGWRARKKGFAYYEEYKGELCIVFKAEFPVQQGLVKSPRFFVAPYVGRRGWTSLRCSTELDWKEIAGLVAESHRLVTSGGQQRRTRDRTSPVPRPADGRAGAGPARARHRRARRPRSS